MARTLEELPLKDNERASLAEFRSRLDERSVERRLSREAP